MTKDLTQRVVAAHMAKGLFTRPTWDEYFLNMAKVAATRGTCARRKVGCVLVDANNRILSTGYNGNAPGLEHCIVHPCPGASHASGSGLDDCEAIHAENNAIALCSDVLRIHTAYLTVSPCTPCTKLLLGTTCQRIVFLEEYPHPRSRELWENAKREWVHHV